MSITDEMTNMVNPYYIAGLQTQHIMSPTPTCNILSGFLRKKVGAAGNGVKITDLIEQGDGRFYRGLDTAEARRANEGTVSHYQEWSNLQEDIVIAGTQLQEVLGMTTSQVVRSDSTLQAFNRNDRLTMINLGAMRTEQAAVSGMEDVDRTLWGDFLPGDNENRMPPTLDQLFDETGPFHGIGPDDLGNWDPAKQVWAESPPNSDGSTKRHIPQIFHNSGTKRNVSRDVLLKPNILMMANISGYWIAPTHPDLFYTLSREPISENDRVPLYAGTRWEYKVDCVKYYNSYYYVEQRAPSDRIRHLHIGMQNGMGGSFFPFAWQAPDTVDLESLLSADDPTPSIPGIQMGNSAVTWPWFTQEWTRSERYANAIYSELELKYMWLCLYRWKQFEVRDLQA